MMEFHISRNARERYQFAESLFSYSGNVVFANVAACREFAHRMNKVRDVEKHPEQAVHAGQLYAMGLIDEASHVLMARYREQFDPQVMTGALEWFSAKFGTEALGKMLLTFVEQFPGVSVMRGEMTPVQWLAGQTEGTSHWAVALEELLLLWTANRNEAFHPFEELFEEKSLAEKTVYRQVTEQLPDYFATRPLIPLPGSKPMNLLELLRAPAQGAPRSLSDQLALIRKLWKPMLGESLERFLLIAGEILHEEELAIWMQFNPPSAAAEAAERHRRMTGQQQWPSIVSTAEVPVFGDPAHEYEKFSPDTAWMPTAVLVAKSTYVWLAQMSKQYGRTISRLDEIPDEELATLARRGLNSLWLIGVWERSRASKTIKLLCGNSDAVASAYSLFDYQIAEDLGGEAAYINLRDRAYRHGLRLASDMVPNHMGIDSPWVVEHPEWFISRPESPYPAYTFNGPDLSQDGRVEIKIEDHYFEQSDAAVVFRRRDRSSGETRYIYHGNDGTSFPWNDTAQLDYLNPAVREQVIQTILHVARLFPVIRFDAAMTLAKRHFHRLWFPGPGSSGAIPSRAESGMSQEEFDKYMPYEFWREVVDRVATEVPGTLLLAEAFWLMEGYFVRTLGMHRVYNSAFMVMLRDEDNAKYRSVIKNTLEFDPDIMKRYVNFMSNPDERTAIDQFGKGDKCFGVAAMMATLPGLPMFGHGQIEGFTEKYGMEYKRPRYDETPDPWMVERHEREIAPLLQHRQLFAESGNFLLYDFFLDTGKVDENVFAYSNRNGAERALVVFNNRYGQTHGTIDFSAAYADKCANQLRQQRISEGLGFTGSPNAILAWRDSFTGLEYLRRSSDMSERGITLDLRAYQCHVFLDWRELHATAEQPWDRLCDQLNGHGVANLEDALANLELQPVHDALRAQLESGIVRQFADFAVHPRAFAAKINTEMEAARTEYFQEAWVRCESFLRLAQKAYLARAGSETAGARPANPGLLAKAFRGRMQAAMRIPAVEALFPAPWTVAARSILPSPSPQLTATAIWGPVLGWCVLELLAESIDAENPERIALDLFDRLRLREPFAQAFTALGYEGEEGWRVAARIKVVLLTGAGVGRPEEKPSASVAEATTAESQPLAAPEPVVALDERVALTPALWSDPDVRWLTGVHHAKGHAYLVRELYEELLWWLLMPSLLRLADEAAPSRAVVEAMSKTIEEALGTAEAAGFRVDLLLEPATAEDAEEEQVSEAHSGTEPEAEAEAEAAVEPEGESEAESEALADTPSLPAEDRESAASEIEPVVESTGTFEGPAEPQPLLAEQSEPVEPEIEPAAEPEAESEASTEAQPLPAEQSEPAEPEIDPEPEVAAEPAVELEASAEPQLLPTEDREPAISEIDPAVDYETESEVEREAGPEASTEAQALPAEQLEPVEPEIVPAESEAESEALAEAPPLPAEDQVPAASEIEPVVESAAESTSPTEEPAEPQTLQTAQLKLTEPEIEPESDAAVEPTVEPEAQALPEEDRDPAISEIDPAVNYETESEIEREAGPEASTEAQPLPAEQLELVEPEIVPAESEALAEAPSLSAEDTEPAEPGIEPVVESAAEPTGAIEEPAEPQTLPTAQLELTEPEIEPESDVAVEPTVEPEAQTLPEEDREPAISEIDPAVDYDTESEVEREVEPEASTEAQPFPAEQLDPAEPEDETESGAAAELSAEPEVQTQAQPSRVEDWEKAVAEIGYSVEPALKPMVEPEVQAEPQSSLTEHLQPASPEIEAEANTAAKPKAELEKSAQEQPSPAERWEPAAPEIEFGAKPATEPRTMVQTLRSFIKLWEPATPKIEFVAEPATEPKAVAQTLPSFVGPWEPLAPKIEFAAKPAAEPEAEPEPSAEKPPSLTPASEPQEQKVEPEAGPEDDPTEPV